MTTLSEILGKIKPPVVDSGQQQTTPVTAPVIEHDTTHVVNPPKVEPEVKPTENLKQEETKAALRKMTVAELREYARTLGIDSGGKKKELQNRIAETLFEAVFKPALDEPTEEELEIVEAEASRQPETEEDDAEDREETEAERASRETPETAAVGLVIAADCRPVKWPFGETITLGEWLRPEIDQLCADQEVLHWNLVQYRRGEFMLSRLCEEKLKTHQGNLLVLCDTRSHEWAACGSVLQEFATAVIQ